MNRNTLKKEKASKKDLKMRPEAKRYNDGKLEWHNFPLFLLKPLMGVAMYGSKKYDTYNFLKGANINQYMNSLKRHVCAFEDPTESDIDNESKCHHLAHAAWNALIAIYTMQNREELDNRYKIEK